MAKKNKGVVTKYSTFKSKAFDYMLKIVNHPGKVKDALGVKGNTKEAIFNFIRLTAADYKSNTVTVETEIFEDLILGKPINYFIEDNEVMDLIENINLEKKSDICHIFETFEDLNFRDVILYKGKIGQSYTNSILKSKFPDKYELFEKEGFIHVKEKSMCGYIHMPNRERSYAFRVFVQYFDDSDFVCSENTLDFQVLFTDGDDVANSGPIDDAHWDSTPYVEPSVEKMFNIISNFLLYSKCFPDKVIDGFPRGSNIFRCIKIPANGKVTVKKFYQDKNEDGVRSVRPHVRRGHFKVLRSDFYTKARGKVIFIEATYVKGKAKTAIE